MSLVTPISFSDNEQFIAYSTPDGTLQYWDIKNNKLKKTIKSSSHLTSTCTCLKWGIKNYINAKNNKNKKSFINYLVIGSQDGQITFYNILTDKFTKVSLNEGHSDVVTDLCFNTQSANELFSCSKDKQIIQWDISNFTQLSKWKYGKGELFSICLTSNGKNLIGAGRSIKLWDVSTKKLLKTFTGHATEVYNLSIIPTHEVSKDSYYFVSTAIADRHINLWQINENVKNSVATFLLPEASTHVFINKSEATNNIKIMAVTKSGYLIIFRYNIKGVTSGQKKPLLHNYFVQVASSQTDKPIPIIFASLNSSQSELTIGYGELMNVIFETLKFSDLQDKTTLIREDVFKRAITLEKTVTNNVTPKISKHVSVVDAGIKTTKSSKRSEPSEPSMGECLVAIGNKVETKQEVPQANTMSTLLTQGLRSEDKKILNNVLQRSQSDLITNTVRGMSISVVVPLIRELEKRTRGHSQSGLVALKWLRAVLVNHTAFLMSYPDLRSLFSDMYQMMENRVSVYSRLCKVQGKLDIMLSQISLQSSNDDVDTSVQHPMLIYQDESEDDSNLFRQDNESSDEDEWGNNRNNSNSDVNIEDSDIELMSE